MKLFLFKYLEQVSGNYHSGGGLVIIAPDKEVAKEIVKQDPNIKLDWKKLTVEHEIDTDKVAIYVFPDAGCC